jgi:hypothetical protein
MLVIVRALVDESGMIKNLDGDEQKQITNGRSARVAL